jgi:uncharacterized membrane protein YedE/YeeE
MNQATTTILSPLGMSKKIHSIPMLIGLVLLVLGSIALYISSGEMTLPAMLIIGVLFGMTLYHASFGFGRSYRRLMLYGDITGMRAQLVMLAVATILFAPLFATEYLADPEAMVSPISMQMIIGAFVFGISMQIADGCASGCLYEMGGGDTKMVITVLGFIAGAFFATLHLEWWGELPVFAEDGFSFVAEYGWFPAAAGQLAFIVLAIVLLTRFGKSTPCKVRLEREEAHRGLSAEDRGWKTFFIGPWPIFVGAGALAILNWLTTLITGAPWGVVSAFSLWGAKTSQFFGFTPEVEYWENRAELLENSVFMDTTSVVNMGVILGALLAAIWAKKFAPKASLPLKTFLATIIASIIMGYSARLAFGCNIGAFFSGVATFSLHGWIWLFAALPGVWIGAKLRPMFGLDSTFK